MKNKKTMVWLGIALIVAGFVAVKRARMARITSSITTRAGQLTNRADGNDVT